MEIAITKISSKGQVVIPQIIRKNIPKGEKFIVYEIEGRIIMEKVDKITKKLKEDLEFARRTEEAWKQIDAGKCKTMEFDEFIEKMKKR